jgi:hypothetical protein
MRKTCGVADRVRWGDFEVAAAELAGRARTLIESPGYVFLGTIRRDGSPRISPVEAHLVGGELMLVMIPQTHKARDLIGDPRVLLQSPIANAAHPGTELKLTGRAITVVDDSQRDAAASQIEVASGWRPPGSWLFAAIDIERVAILEWQQDEMILSRWDRSRGTQGPERRRLDFDTGTYARA